MFTNLVLTEVFGIGGQEMIFILLIVLLLFGGKKLPEFARGLGKGIREFKDASEGVKREIHRNINSVDVDEKSDVITENKDILDKKVPLDQQIVDEIQAAKTNQSTSTEIPS